MNRTIFALSSILVTAVLPSCSDDSATDAPANTECADKTLDCAPCGAGEHRCDGAVLKVCQADGEGFDPVMTCATEALCVKGVATKACAAPECGPADGKCEGSVMKLCAAGRDKWEMTTCTSAAACAAGLKDGKCAAGECSVASECAGQDSECRKRTCNGGVCGWQDLPPGTISTTQEEGDCKRRICDGQGGAITEPLSSDVPTDNDDCTVGSCEGSTPKTLWAPIGTVCNGTGACDGAGLCVACAAGKTQCKGNAVQTCQPAGQWDLGTECANKACVNGACVGSCVPGEKGCEAQVVQMCDATGTWQAQETCAWPKACVDGACAHNPSCAGLPATCGSSGTESCCASALVPGGAYPMGRSVGGPDAFATGHAHEVPEHSVTVSDFRLDLYEVTVGRFRKFVEAYPGNKPVAGAGANPNVNGTGWEAGWTSSLPADQAALKQALKCDAGFATWRDAAAGTELLPINCVSWFEALAFCAWDGGWLPTEAEWEKAAAGGDENRLYPWGQAAPDITRASYKCAGDGSAQCAFTDILAVGSKPAGEARWGHHDLAGNLFEWVFDSYSASWYSGGGASCSNCANVTNATSVRGRRGAYFLFEDASLRAAFRDASSPTTHGGSNGFRCARPAP